MRSPPWRQLPPDPASRAHRPSSAPQPLALLLCMLLGISACGGRDAQEPRLVVSAASSLAEVVTRLADEFRQIEPETTVSVNSAASGTLVQQIRQGAAVDVFISAADREMALLSAERLVDEATIMRVASNELVLVVPADHGGTIDFADLATAETERVALGAPPSVPAGAYAREVLEHLGLWRAVEPKAVFASSVRQALTYVEAGEVDAALVYRTDALRAPRVRVTAVAPKGSHSPIRYSAAVVNGTRHEHRARRFVAFLRGPTAAAVFLEHGFRPPTAVEAY